MRRSFIEVSSESHFPIQNLPYGSFSRNGEPQRIGVAIGEYVLDLACLQQAGLLSGDYFLRSSLNAFFAKGRAEWTRVRSALQELLDEANPTLRDNDELRKRALIPIDQVRLHLPVEIGDYTDFYSSKEHATNVGSMFRDPTNALLPNWLHLPVAYHGRASSIVVSGTSIRRPHGQLKSEAQSLPTFGPTRFMDFELEVGCIIGTGNTLGEPIHISNASDHVFGMVLVNDWSARDIQSWEYVPLGPFLGKNLGTSISPWVVTLDALSEFRVPGPVQDPLPLPYLQMQQPWTLDIDLTVLLQSPMMQEPETVSRGNFSTLYWNICQQIAHHTSNGCNLRPGDLLASGTISGKDPLSFGSMLELTWRGARPITLLSGEQRASLQDGDTVLMRGAAYGKGYTIGFGEVVGSILPALGW
jgi:fumarylacetoacetase